MTEATIKRNLKTLAEMRAELGPQIEMMKKLEKKIKAATLALGMDVESPYGTVTVVQGTERITWDTAALLRQAKKHPGIYRAKTVKRSADYARIKIN